VEVFAGHEPFGSCRAGRLAGWAPLVASEPLLVTGLAEVRVTGVAAKTNRSQPPAPSRPIRLERLLPPGEPAAAEEIVAGLGLEDRSAVHSGRPYLILNMVSTVDGRASLGGRSRPLGSPTDRELFHALRRAVDAVLVGAGTARSERYGRIIGDRSRRRERRERGLRAEPLACIASGRLSVPADLPLFADPAARVVIVTSSAASLPGTRAEIEYLRMGREGRVDLAAALTELRERFAVATLLCEGGPHLNSQLLLEGLVDELFLTLSPKLAGDGASPGEALRIIAGVELEPPLELALLGALRSDSELFLRYAVVSAGERVSRETTLNSSPAS
jgi:riboflavin-specific deaminase-like protein